MGALQYNPPVARSVRAATACEWVIFVAPPSVQWTKGEGDAASLRMAGWGMVDPTQSRSVRVRSYQEMIRDAGGTFRLALGVDVRTALKRAALAAIRMVEG